MHASWKKLHNKVFQFLPKKLFFSPKWWYGEKMYKLLNQSNIIQDLTCKLCLVLWKNFMRIFWVKWTTFHKNCHILLKITDPWIFVVGILKPQVHAYMPRNTSSVFFFFCTIFLFILYIYQFYLACFLEKTSQQSYFIFDKKVIFYPKMMVMEKKCICS